MASSELTEKFRGCLLGGLIGDCFGRNFEFQRHLHPTSKKAWCDFLVEKLTSDESSGKILPYTDDTEMTRSVTKSLITKKGFDAKDMARRHRKFLLFTKEFFRSQSCHIKRGYGSHVYSVFVKLEKEEAYNDVFEPAKQQFDFKGSCGNGGAMRTHPVALFCFDKSQDKLLEISRKVAQLTHAHIDGYNGAILQSLAARFALEMDPKDAFDPMNFLDKLEEIMSVLESKREESNPDFPSYCTQIGKIRTCLKENIVDATDIGEILGNLVLAQRSVPTAIYCFLRSQETLPDYETNNPFLRTLYLSVAIGGDTDTIACMACSLAGAFYGLSHIPNVLYEQCEASADILKQADHMAQLVGVIPTNHLCAML